MFKDKSRKSLTLLEIVIILVILCVLAAFSFSIYTKFIEKAKTSEAIVSAGHIRESQIAQQFESGKFIAADNTDEINKALGLEIYPKDFEYKVVDVTDENFLILAYKIDENIKAGNFTPESIVVAMDKYGMVHRYPQTGSSGGGTSGTGGTGTPGTGGSGGGGTGSGGGIGGSGGGTGGSGGGTGTGGGSTGGTADVEFGYRAIDVEAILAILGDSQAGAYFYDLIMNKDVSVSFGNTEANVFGYFIPTWWRDFYPDYTGLVNAIYLSNNLKYTWTNEAIACVLIHETVHADYNHNTEKWVAATIARYGVDRSELNWYVDPVTGEEVLGDSLDQEYNCFVQETILWKEIRGNQTNREQDYRATLYDQGGTALYDYMASIYEGLPLYDKEL